MGASFYPSAFSWVENIVFLRRKRCFRYCKTMFSHNDYLTVIWKQPCFTSYFM